MTAKKRLTCVHIIIRDKFTSGYIEFLKNNDMNWNHIFFTFPGNSSIPRDGVIIVKNYSEIATSHLDALMFADRIVVASFFDNALALLKLPDAVWKKTYIQFWGGDIYRFRVKRKGIIPRIKQYIAWMLTRMCILRCGGVLTLVKKDYQYIEEIYKLNNLVHYVVQVPDDFYAINHIDYSGIMERNPYTGKKRILIGNSATSENAHIEIFEIFRKKNFSEYEFVVPLSYGDSDYRNEVLMKGKEMLGASFRPILEFYDRDKYVSLLGSCSAAVFNNNRQQATGNIIMMANLGKKIYLRSDTSMWDFFSELGFKIYDVSELANDTIDAITDCSDEDEKQNHLALAKMESEAIEQWREFLS